MSREDDAGRYFQTTDSLATSERKARKAKNKHGQPIILSSKVLAACPDPSHQGSIYVAEAAGEVKRIVLETNEVQKAFAGGTAPLTCVAVSAAAGALFAGCWDKHIYKINCESKKAVRRFIGHGDFVKTVLTTALAGKQILISGSADATIIVWDVDSGKQLHRLKGHTKSVQDLALDPLSLDEGAREPRDSFVLFSGSSDREIRRWRVSLESASELPESVETPILAHETSVYKLCFDSEGDLWTASADKTARHLVRERGWEVDTVLQHPDFVRDVVVNEVLGLVVTACRDEEVRVWDSASGDLVCTYSGHYEEVTGLVLVGRQVVSVGIDGTVRRWDLERQAMLRYQEEMRSENGEMDAADAAKKNDGSLLTAEEEAELAELLDDD